MLSFSPTCLSAEHLCLRFRSLQIAYASIFLLGPQPLQGSLFLLVTPSLSRVSQTQKLESSSCFFYLITESCQFPYTVYLTPCLPPPQLLLFLSTGQNLIATLSEKPPRPSASCFDTMPRFSPTIFQWPHLLP